jgi:dethiobiotin synthetase
MKIPTVIVARSKVGTVNHTIMTVMMCQKYKIPIKGIIINNFDEGYPINQLTKDLENLTGIKVLGTIPFIKDMNGKSLYRIFKKNLDLELLLK